MDQQSRERLLFVQRFAPSFLLIAWFDVENIHMALFPTEILKLVDLAHLILKCNGLFFFFFSHQVGVSDPELSNDIEISRD